MEDREVRRADILYSTRQSVALESCLFLVWSTKFALLRASVLGRRRKMDVCTAAVEILDVTAFIWTYRIIA